LRSIAELRGLRFPDEYVVKMFFKEGLQHSTGRVLELGCGNGNNLMLFVAFGWNVTGVDYSGNALADARHNLSGVGTLVEADLSTDVPPVGDGMFDAILLPSVNYYLPRASFVRLLGECRRLIRLGGMFYIRSRLPDDWRWGRGQEEEPGGFRLNRQETGECGLLNVFYAVDELSALIREHFGELQGLQRLHVAYDNPQGGIVVRNSDVVIWGRTTAA
jgi:SAM-dependent methyltransferase